MATAWYQLINNLFGSRNRTDWYDNGTVIFGGGGSPIGLLLALTTPGSQETSTDGWFDKNPAPFQSASGNSWQVRN